MQTQHDNFSILFALIFNRPAGPEAWYTGSANVVNLQTKRIGMFRSCPVPHPTFAGVRDVKFATDSIDILTQNTPFIPEIHYFYPKKHTFLHFLAKKMQQESENVCTIQKKALPLQPISLPNESKRTSKGAHKVLFIYIVLVSMDTFLDLPFWLSVTLGVLYGAIWVVFFVVLYATHHHARHRRYSTEGGEEERVSVFRTRTSADRTSTLEEMSVYDEDDD